MTIDSEVSTNERHQEILDGLDPFRIYKVPKKTLQLEVKLIFGEIGHISSRDELLKFSKYPIEYYDNYFMSWGEVTAAARTTGMSEKRNGNNGHEIIQQMRLLERKGKLKT